MKKIYSKTIKTIRIFLIIVIFTSLSANTVLSIGKYSYNELYNISELNENGNSPIVSTTYNNITVNIWKTISDSRSVYTIFTVNTLEDFTFSEKYFFDRIRFNCSSAGASSCNVALLNENSHERKYMACIAGTEDIKSGILSLSLKDLYKYKTDDQGNKIKAQKGCGYEKETIIEGNWTLEWYYDKNIEPDIIETYPYEKLSFNDINESISIDKITISPLSFSVDFSLDDNTAVIDSSMAGNLSFCINFKDGNKITDMDNPHNAIRVIKSDNAACFCCCFDNIVNINDIRDISVNGICIPIH